MFPVEIWGTVGQWASSLLTGGSLFLGFTILRINQQDKRREQAAKVMFTVKAYRDIDTDAMSTIEGTVYNHSDAVINDAGVILQLRDEVARRKYGRVDLYIDPTLKIIAHSDVSYSTLPGESFDYVVNVPPNAGVSERDTTLTLRILDGNGVVWDRVAHQVPVEHKFPRFKKQIVITIFRGRRLKSRFKSSKFLFGHR